MAQSIWISAEIIKLCLDRAGIPEWPRIMKVQEEAGEVADAYIGWMGYNPGKGNYGGRDEVIGELADTVLTALTAMVSLLGDVRQVERAVERCAQAKATRMQEAVG